MSRKTSLLIISGFLLLASCFLLLFRSPSPAHAACPPGCTEEWTPRWGTCYDDRCTRGCPDKCCAGGGIQGCTGACGLASYCAGKCCGGGHCETRPYSCIVGWDVDCSCPDPEGCSGGCPQGWECIDGNCIAGEEDVPHAGCDADHPCPEDYVCEGGRCRAQCNQVCSGPCCPGVRNDCCWHGGDLSACCPGERCCRGTAGGDLCCTSCCGGGGPTPDTTNPSCGLEVQPQVTGPNLVQNGGFESTYKCGDARCPRDWDAFDFTSDGKKYKYVGKIWVHSGRYGARSACKYSKLTQHIPVEQGAIYKLSLWARATYLFFKEEYKGEIEKRWCRASASILIDGGGGGGRHGAHIVRACHRKPFCASDWKYWEATIYAHDSVLTISLVGDIGKDNPCPWCSGEWGRAGFDDVKLEKITTGTVTSPNVDVRVGVWDNRGLSGLKIQNADGSWPEEWTDFSWRKSRYNYPATLTASGELWAAVRDGAGNRGFCKKSGIPVMGTISGYIWNDLNNNDGTGKDPPSEPNYTASTVMVSYSCPSMSESVATTTSDGNYTFDNVPAENCMVSRGGLASGWSGTTPASVSVTVPMGGTATVNFGVWKNPKAWFQGCNGDIYGFGGVTILVPHACEVCCDRWALGADPNNIGGGVVISGNATLSGVLCSERPGSIVGWNVKSQVLDWPSSLSFSYPSDATATSSTTLALQSGKSYVWRLLDNKLPKKGGTYSFGTFHPASGVAVLYVEGDFAIDGKFKAHNSDTQGVVIVVNGNVTIDRDTAGRDLEEPPFGMPGSDSDIDAAIIASGTISITGNDPKKRLVIKGMVYGKGGISVTGEELEDNRYPRLKTIYNPIYFHAANPLAKPSIIWREIAP